MGPSGKDGTNGVDGIDGKDGKDDEDGKDGNANVFSSEWINLNSWDEITFSYSYHTIPAPEVTEDIINSGVVLVYVQLLSDAGNTRMLPVSFFYGLYIHYFDFMIQPNSVIVYFENSGSGGTPATSGNLARYVVIPSSALSAKHMDKESVQKMSYEEVSQVFDIQ